MSSDVLSLLHPLGIHADGAVYPHHTFLATVREAACALRGHSLLLHTEPGRIFLKCMDCGHETPGWSVAEAPRRPRR